MKKVLVALLLISQLSTFAQNYKFGKVSKEEVEEKFYPLDSTADAAYLYKERRSFFNYVQNEGFELVTEIYERIKIYNKEGFNYANKSINYYKPESGDSESVIGIKGYTFNIENNKLEKEKLSKKSIFKEKVNKYRSRIKITMPKIKEGTIIEIKYRISSPYTTSIKDINFQQAIPIKNLNAKLEIPEFYVFNKMSKGYYSVPMKTSSKNGNLGETTFTTDVFSFEGKDIPALKNNEPYVSNINNYRGGIGFELAQTNFVTIGGDYKNYSTNWENVSEQIFKSSSFGDEIDKKSFYKKDLETILLDQKTEKGKIAAIFKFVKEKVKWNGFYGKYTENGVRGAYKKNTGNVADINLMLTSMLRSAGLEANPVLISSRGNGIPLFPTLKGFDYVICNVDLANNTSLLLDATELYSEPNILPARVLNWNGRKVTKDGASSWIKLNSSKPAIEENIIMVKITDDMMVEGLCRTKYDNLNALNFRKNTNHIKEESLITRLEESKNIEIEDFKIINQKKLGKPVTRNIKFVSEDLVENINGKLYIEPLLFLSHHENPFKLKERKFPVDFVTPWRDRNSVSIQIPEGYKVESLPESIAIGLPNGMAVFKYQVAQDGNKINAGCIIQFKQAMIAPQYYTALKEFYAQMVKKESEKIVLVKI